MKVAWIGTGLMGRPMAERLLAAGHRLTVFNRTREKALPLAAAGARVAGSAGEAVAGAEVVVLMLRDAAAIRGVLASGQPPPDFAGRTVIQMSTIGAEESVGIGGEVEAAGGDYLEAPVLGSTPQAGEGKLLVLVGATPESFERFAPLLSCFGEPRRVGGVGQAAALKLALNQLIATELAAFSLSLGLVRRRGLDIELFMDVLRRSALYAPTFDAKLPGMLARRFEPPRFPAALLLKDVDLVRAEAAALGLETAALDGVRALVAKAVDGGLADWDYSALYEVVDPR